MSVARRLAKLEAVADPSGAGLAHLTWDELEIRILDLSRRIAVDDTSTADERATAADRVARIEAGIRAQAVLRRRPGYDTHVAWVARGRTDYLPAICGDDSGHANSCLEYSDLDRPRIMERRAAILARSDVRALIESTADA